MPYFVTVTVIYYVTVTVIAAGVKKPGHCRVVCPDVQAFGSVPHAVCVVNALSTIGYCPAIANNLVLCQNLMSDTSLFAKTH